MDWVSVLSGIFVLVGVALLAASVKQFSQMRRFLRRSASVPGVIIALRENREAEEISYFPKVKFRTASGSEVTFESRMGGSAQAARVGAVVAVRYRPDQPELAEIDSFMSLWGASVLFAVLGVVFLFVGLAVLGGLLPI